MLRCIDPDRRAITHSPAAVRPRPSRDSPPTTDWGGVETSDTADIPGLRFVFCHQGRVGCWCASRPGIVDSGKHRAPTSRCREWIAHVSVLSSRIVDHQSEDDRLRVAKQRKRLIHHGFYGESGRRLSHALIRSHRQLNRRGNHGGHHQDEGRPND